MSENKNGSTSQRVERREAEESIVSMESELSFVFGNNNKSLWKRKKTWHEQSFPSNQWIKLQIQINQIMCDYSLKYTNHFPKHMHRLDYKKTIWA